MEDRPMELSVNKTETDANFTINGDIDEQGAEILKKNFLALDRSTLNNVTFDFKMVNHIGSAGIGKLLLFYKDIALSGGELKIINASGEIHKLFLTLKLDTVFSIQKA